MLRVTNPVVRLLLRTPAGGPMRKQFMVLAFTGRKTGRRYDIPVVAHRLGGELYSLTDAHWRHNFRGGAGVEVTLQGHATPCAAAAAARQKESAGCSATIPVPPRNLSATATGHR